MLRAEVARLSAAHEQVRGRGATRIGWLRPDARLRDGDAFLRAWLRRGIMTAAADPLRRRLRFRRLGGADLQPCTPSVRPSIHPSMDK